MMDELRYLADMNISPLTVFSLLSRSGGALATLSGEIIPLYPGDDAAG